METIISQSLLNITNNSSLNRPDVGIISNQSGGNIPENPPTVKNTLVQGYIKSLIVILILEGSATGQHSSSFFLRVMT